MNRRASPTDLMLGTAAYEDLPERSRLVLWHVLLDREPVSLVATAVGVTGDEVGALIDAAHEELRASLIRRYTALAERPACAEVLGPLDGYHDRRLPDSVVRSVSDHLATCDHCRGALRWIDDLSALMEEAVLPSVLGPEAAARYLDLRDI